MYSIIEYLDNHYSGRLSLVGIAERFFISATYLCRIFKQTTGFTIIEYLNIVRIREAKALLTQTKWPITRVAAETGFESIAHFGRKFKAITGRSLSSTASSTGDDDYGPHPMFHSTIAVRDATYLSIF